MNSIGIVIVPAARNQGRSRGLVTTHCSGGDTLRTIGTFSAVVPFFPMVWTEISVGVGEVIVSSRIGRGW